MSGDTSALATHIMVMAIVISVMLLFVGIGVLICIHICIVGRTFRRGFDSDNMVERTNVRSNSMSYDDVEKLPSFDFKALEKGSSPIDCVVCLENFKMGDKCRLLPICKHSFHAYCVDSWLLKTPICPICRTSADTTTKKILISQGDQSSNSGDVGQELSESHGIVQAISTSS